MTFAESKKIAAVLKAVRPDPATATVGERLLWGRLSARMLDTIRGMPISGYDDDAWRDAAGVDAPEED